MLNQVSLVIDSFRRTIVSYRFSFQTTVERKLLDSTSDEATYVGLHQTLFRELRLTRLLAVNKSLWPLSLLTLLIALAALATGMSAAC